jgi:hypothetical protein
LVCYRWVVIQQIQYQLGFISRGGFIGDVGDDAGKDFPIAKLHDYALSSNDVLCEALWNPVSEEFWDGYRKEDFNKLRLQGIIRMA